MIPDNNIQSMPLMPQQVMPQQCMPLQCMPLPCMPMLAKAYVPFQCLYCIYPPLRGLKQGTIFPELDRPYGMDPEYTVDA